MISIVFKYLLIIIFLKSLLFRYGLGLFIYLFFFLLEHHIHIVINPITLDKQVDFLMLDYTTRTDEPNILVSNAFERKLIRNYLEK